MKTLIMEKDKIKIICYLILLSTRYTLPKFLFHLCLLKSLIEEEEDHQKTLMYPPWIINLRNSMIWFYQAMEISFGIQGLLKVNILLLFRKKSKCCHFYHCKGCDYSSFLHLVSQSPSIHSYCHFEPWQYLQEGFEAFRAS